ncbi:MAG: peroxiredoxin [Myxococcaceae bacterium]|nr:peroxiredoxin [Myxococcaceae bacterium]
MKLKEGMKAPPFAEQAMHKNKWIVLYFYPKDDTPGCTREACGFRDLSAEFAKENAVILGVSKDSVESHERFQSKYQLPFPLISDPELKLHEAYGAYGSKVLYGKTSLGVIRSTFLIDPEGIIAKAWYSVKVDEHVAKVLEAIRKGS